MERRMAMRPRHTLALAAIPPEELSSSAPPCEAFRARHVDVKSLQSNKIKEIGQALSACGLVALDAQARALGISRSTAWTIVGGHHKASGLSATVINQMLSAPQLPPVVRAILFEYIEEKIAGSYGHSSKLVRQFATRLHAERLRHARKICSESSAGLV